MQRVSATEAARNFSDLLNRVRYQGIAFEIARGNEAIAHIVPAVPPQTMPLAELDQHFMALPQLDPDDAVQFEADLQDLRQTASLPDPQWE